MKAIIVNEKQSAQAERAAFSARLVKALKDASYTDSPTELSREFNVRYGGAHVTVHAARKWLVGEAIPTQDKVRVLSDWLAVSIEWLRFGGTSAAAPHQSDSGRLSSADVRLLSDLQSLDDKTQRIAREFIQNLARADRRQSAEVTA
jgi:hypothetical protein